MKATIHFTAADKLAKQRKERSKKNKVETNSRRSNKKRK